MKDVDSADSAQRLHSLAWSGYGGILGMFLGFGIAMRGGQGLLGIVLYALAGLGIGWAFIHFISVFLAERSGAAMASIYMASGSSTPAKREYSRADALNAHGKYEEAAAEYRRFAQRYPTDPEPLLRLARMLRDRMQQYDEAAQTFRQVMAIEGVDAGVWIQASRELAELYTHRLEQPERALPTLAQLQSRYPATPAGEWARSQMAEIKRAMRQKNE